MNKNDKDIKDAFFKLCYNVNKIAEYLEQKRHEDREKEIESMEQKRNKFKLETLCGVYDTPRVKGTK